MKKVTHAQNLIFLFIVLLQDLACWSDGRKMIFLFQKWFLTRKSVLVSTLRTSLSMVVLC